MINDLKSASDIDILRWIKDNKRLKSINEVPESYKCARCMDLLVNPIQTKCGCRYCHDCFRDYLKKGDLPCVNSSECDNNSLGDFMSIDRAANRDILKVTIECPFTNCNEEAEIRNIKAHMLECKNMEVMCASCEMYYLKSEEETHGKEVCSKRIISCPYCSMEIQHWLLEADHYNPESPALCHEYKGDCPNGCGKVILYNHKDSCPNKTVICPFPTCRKTFTNGTVNEHFLNDSYSHFTQFMEDSVRKNKEIDLLEENFKSKVEELKIMRERCESLSKSEAELVKKLNSLKSIRPNTRNTQNIRKDIFRKGSYIWRIDNFAQLKNDAENRRVLSMMCDPFYTSDFGYKLCMKIYPAGDGIGCKTHLSVYFVVMKGEYDNIQSWPFRNKVTLSIVSANKLHSETFKPDPTSPCYAKPINECNIASGSPKFIKFDELSKFIIDDTLFIKMSVNLS